MNVVTKCRLSVTRCNTTPPRYIVCSSVLLLLLGRFMSDVCMQAQ